MESPSNADVVTLQVGSTLRRTDKQQDSGLLLALVDTVTVNRKTAVAVSSESNPGGAVQKPRAIADNLPPTNIALPHDGLAYRFPFDTEKRTYPVFRDREELPGSSDLGDNISSALEGSRYLIVVCSPNAAVSRWVNEEIKTFKAMGREDRIRRRARRRGGCDHRSPAGRPGQPGRARAVTESPGPAAAGR